MKVGQEIEAKVVDFNGEDKKISLSMKALLPVQDKTETPVEQAVEEPVETPVEETTTEETAE